MSSFAQVEKVLSSTDGTQIFARAVGRCESQSLVFIHGLALSGDNFDVLFKNEILLNGFYLVSYDMRGHGRSGKPEDEESHTSTLYADDFAAVVKAFNLKSPILVGWSLGATVACDVCAHLSDCIAGIVYAAGLPYIGPIMNEVGTPLILGFLPGFLSMDDVVLSMKTKIAFIDSLVNDPDNVPVSVKRAWLGATALQSPNACKFAISRPQDPEKLFEAGSRGLPLLLINGSTDTQVQGGVVARIMKPNFSNIEAHMIQGGSHAVFYDNEQEFVKILVGFAKRIGNKRKMEVLGFPNRRAHAAPQTGRSVD